MRKTKKRKPDLRRIRTSKTYTVIEIAKTLDRSTATVRGWIRDGLPTLDGHNPPLILGSELKAWLQAKWAARKRPCKPDELYCCKCCQPRTTRIGSVRVFPKNAKTASKEGLCAVCGTRMQQGCSLADMAAIKAGDHPLSPHLQCLSGYIDSSAKPTINSHGCASTKSITYPTGSLLSESTSHKQKSKELL